MPKWLDEAVFYEVYPQSFLDTNSDGIGDLNGIIARLDYIKELGCNAIWINPCFESSFFDAGYDVTDYYTVAQRYGTNEDLKNLFNEAHRRNMHIVLDLVAGHTSINHPWFKESMKLENNKFSGRYIWSDTAWTSFDGIDGISGSIRGFCDRGACAVNYYSTQPALNYGFANITEPWQEPVDSENAKATFKEMTDIMQFWFELGCDGFRVDMAGALVKNDTNQAETIKLWQKFRAFIDKKYPEAILISEWANPPRAVEGGFHMDFLLHFGPSHYLDLFRENPFFAKIPGDITNFATWYADSFSKINEKGYMAIPSGNHDMPRISYKLDVIRLKLAYVFLLTMPGAPFIYYGDEIGMKYLDFLPSKEGGFERTGSRTPMQWDNTQNAGFSSASPEKLYLPLDSSDLRPNVANQMADANSLWNLIKNLIEIRKNLPLQNSGDFEFLHAEKNSPVLMFKRTSYGKDIFIAINPSTSDAKISTKIANINNIIYQIGNLAVIDCDMMAVPSESALVFE